MNKILILFLALVLFIFGYLGWQKYADRTAQLENNETIRIKNITQEPPVTKSDSAIVTLLDDSLPTSKPEPGGFRDIFKKDCDNECQSFTLKEELTYCQEVCGLKTLPEKNQACDTFKDLERDYCFKDEAVSKKNFSLCDKVSDPNIKKTCQNRVTEDILDQ